MSQKIGILGGTFNPIHYGHLAAAEEVRERLKLDRIQFIPSFIPPHKQEEDLPSADQRMAMVRLAIAGTDSFEASDIEITRGGKSYTIDTIETVRRSYRDAELYFITGLDSFLDIQTWKEWERLLTICCFVVLSRPGYSFSRLKKLDFMRAAANELETLDTGTETERVIETAVSSVFLESIPLYDISSTDIRKRIRENRTVKYLLPEPVETYIIQHKLYV